LEGTYQKHINAFSKLQVACTTALMQASQNGHLKCVKLLILNGARCDIRNANGLTAADLAADNGHADIATAIKLFS
jgi:ankyrin repeat domain-containing protein 17